MTEENWKAFYNFREKYRDLCLKWSHIAVELKQLQLQSSEKDTPPYPLENSIVYNRDYDRITKDDDIRLIVIGDNPGKEEQLEKNCRYLVGQSGRIAEGFFRKNPELNIDFRKNAIIMNKTPLHTAKTAHLKYLSKNSSKAESLIEESQKECAVLVSELQKALKCQLWLVGYGELKNKGIFMTYRDVLLDCYSQNSEWNNVFVYQHFSMNRFLIDLKKYQQDNPECILKECLENLGKIHRKEIFGS